MPENIYDDLDLLYRGIWGHSLHHGAWMTRDESIEKALENLIEIALEELKPRGTIADIGCGYGILAHKLVDRFGCSVIANTNSEKQAAQIQQNPDIKILQGDWLNQKLKPESLEGVIAIESLSYFASFDDFLSHTSPALKPGGRIVICDWFSENGSHILLRQLAATGDLPPWRSVMSLASIARMRNLKILQSRNLSREVAPTWSALLWRSITLPFKRPALLPTILKNIVTRPSLLLAFPLIRLAYETGDLEYHVICFEK